VMIIILLPLALMSCSMFEGVLIEYNLYDSWGELRSHCPKAPKGKMTVGCFEPNTGPCVIHAMQGDKKTIDHEIEHCKYGFWHE